MSNSASISTEPRYCGIYMSWKYAEHWPLRPKRFKIEIEVIRFVESAITKSMCD